MDFRTLAWRNIYFIPIVVFPLICLSISAPAPLHVNPIQPTDDLRCDASHPEWKAGSASRCASFHACPHFGKLRGRFLGCSGFSMILTIPYLFLSAAAARRIFQVHRLQRSQLLCKINTCHSHSISGLRHENLKPHIRSGRMINVIHGGKWEARARRLVSHVLCIECDTVL